jgi:hypothetical protein
LSLRVRVRLWFWSGLSREQVDRLRTGWVGAALPGGANVEQLQVIAPRLQPNRVLVNGVIRGVRIEGIEDALMLEPRGLAALFDELAKGKSRPKTLRAPA